jgi:signal transduction histidine kinase
VTSALAGSSAGAVLAAMLLCALLGLIAYFLKQAREGQDRTELLLAELQDAREEQTRAAAIAERGRIAGELHDVLAHALSGAALQLEGARMLAEREGAGEGLRDSIERAAGLVKDGLADARQAVGALRGEQLPGLGELATLIDRFRADTGAEVSLDIEGQARTLPGEAGLALYRGAQEALTNVARYAPGARTAVLLRYEPARVCLTVEDRVPAPAGAGPGPGALGGIGGGRGLDGMRERVERAGGRMEAGPTEAGWRVRLDVPA